MHTKSRSIMARLVTAFLLVMFLVSLVPMAMLAAQSRVEIGLSSKKASLKAGESFNVQVVFATFPNITRFGPIAVQYDANQLQYSGSSNPGQLPATFMVQASASLGIVTLTGVDQQVEGQLIDRQTAPLFDDEGEPIELPPDPSFASTAPVVVCELKFQAMEDIPDGDVVFRVGSINGIRDSSFETVIGSAGPNLILPVEGLYRNDANLSSLDVEGYALSPSFSPDILSYTIEVPSEVNRLSVSAVPHDEAAQVRITGASHLGQGDTMVIVQVTAHDGRTKSEYDIYVVRTETPEEDRSFVFKDRRYTFLSVPDTSALLPGFEPLMMPFPSFAYDVPAYVSPSFDGALMYLRSDDGMAGFYLFDENANTLFPFDSRYLLYMPAGHFLVVEKPAMLDVPDGFRAADVYFDDTSYPGYTRSSDRQHLLYLQSQLDRDVEGFYLVDTDQGLIFPYNATAGREGSFLVPFIVTLVLAFGQAVFLLVLAISVRKNKRAKGVFHT